MSAYSGQMNGVTIIRKSWIGYLYRILFAVSIVAILALFLWVATDYGAFRLSPNLVPAIILFLLLVVVVTATSLYLYSLNYTRLDETGVTVQHWLTLFSDSNDETQWFDITSVDSQQNGILPRIFGFGTLVIQQAGTQQPVYMTLCPNVDYWKDFIQDRASRTPAPVRES